MLVGIQRTNVNLCRGYFMFGVLKYTLNRQKKTMIFFLVIHYCLKYNKKIL